MTNGSAVVVGTLAAVALVALLLGVMIRARREQQTPTDFYLAGRRVGAGQNALAMFAGFILLSTMFTMVGHVALNGFDAFIFAAAFAVSWLVAMLFYAGPLRNIRGTTIADLFAIRAGQRPARIASLVVSLLLYLTYTIVMLNAIGIVCRVAFGVESGAVLSVVVAVAGLCAMVFILIGGMQGLTRLLVIKAIAVIAVLGLLTFAAIVRFRFNPFQMLADAQANALPDPGGFDLLGPGREFGASGSEHIVHLSKLFAVVVGHAGLPYMFMRHFTATSGRDARKAAGWAGMMFVPFYLCTAILGYAGVALLGGKNIGPTPPLRDLTLPRLTDQLASGWLVGILGAVALLMVTGVLAALLISAVTSLTRDVRVLRGVPIDTPEELSDARRNTVIVGIIGVVLGVVLLPAPTHALIPITVDLGGIVLPAVIYSLFWRRFNTTGLQWTIFGGFAVTGAVVLVSGLFSGTPVAMLPNVDFHLLEFDPALITVPIAFLLGYLGTVSSSQRDDAAFAEMQVRAFTGVELPARAPRPVAPKRAVSTVRAATATRPRATTSKAPTKAAPTKATRTATAKAPSKATPKAPSKATPRATRTASGKAASPASTRSR